MRTIFENNTGTNNSVCLIENLKRGNVFTVAGDPGVFLMIHSLKYGEDHKSHAVAVQIAGGIKRMSLKQLKTFTRGRSISRFAITKVTTRLLQRETGANTSFCVLNDVVTYSTAGDLDVGNVYVTMGTEARPFLCIHNKDLCSNYSDTAMLVELAADGERLTLEEVREVLYDDDACLLGAEVVEIKLKNIR